MQTCCRRRRVREPDLLEFVRNWREHGDVSLRDYQWHALEAAVNAATNHDHIHVLSLPTGAGKTRIAVALAGCFLAHGFHVLWVSKNWELLRQASDEFAEVFPRDASKRRRIGGEHDLLHQLADDGRGRIFFTTLQTWICRRERLPVASPAVASSGGDFRRVPLGTEQQTRSTIPGGVSTEGACIWFYGHAETPCKRPLVDCLFCAIL